MWLKYSSLIISATALLLNACGSGNEFRGQGLTGSDNGKIAKPSSRTTTIIIPSVRDDGTIEPIESGTSHEPIDELNERVVFGDDKVYRVGDGVVDGTSCMESINAHELSGTTYRFNFTVTSDDTAVQLGVNELCGIDVNDFNLVGIYKGDDSYLNATLTKGQTKVTLQPIRLNAGEYAFEVRSTKITTQQYNGHFDDFIIGKISVSSDKKIVPGEVVAH